MVFELTLCTPGHNGAREFGIAYAAALNAVEPQLRIEFRDLGGYWYHFLEQGEILLVLLDSSSAWSFLHAAFGLQIVAPAYSSAGLFLVPGGSPVHRIADLKDRPVVMTASRGLGGAWLGGLVLQALQIPVQGITVELARDSLPMLQGRRALALWGMWGAGEGWPAVHSAWFSTLVKSGGHFLAPESDEISRILERQPELKAVTMPAGTYPGQEALIDSVGSWSLVLVGPGLPDEQGYLLARALHRAEGALAAGVPHAREATLANLLKAAPRTDLIHPGVLSYLREAGIVR